MSMSTQGFTELHGQVIPSHQLNQQEKNNSSNVP